MAQTGNAPRNYAGFDANQYPGDDQLATLHKQFAFTGYWLNNPPGATSNPWAGKREALARAGFGFLVAFNGRLDNEILAAQKTGKPPAAFARQDAAVAVAAARREGFLAGTIIFLDQEEGGRMLPEQAAYLLGWTEAVAATVYKPGVYTSGKPVPEEDENGRKITITTIQDIRAQVAAKHLHPIAFWVYQDACPPAPGCLVDPAKLPAPDVSGTFGAVAWQFAQSPQEKDITRACSSTYSRDGNCYLPGAPPALAHYRLDLSVSTSADPSHGR
ncbi:MAG TPA: glycoside hydrolase domain-containing protein [Acidobacteriaceae bacterium]